MTCDLCGGFCTPGHPLPPELMQFMAAQGFNPFSEPDIALVAGASDYSSWLERVATRTSGWALCSTCSQAVSDSHQLHLPFALSDTTPPSDATRLSKLFSRVGSWLLYLLAFLVLSVITDQVDSWLMELLIILAVVGLGVAGWLAFKTYHYWEEAQVSNPPLLGGNPPTKGEVRGMVVALASLVVFAVLFAVDLIWLVRALPFWVVGASLGAVCLANLLTVSISASLGHSGYETDESHEWRLLDGSGKPAARIGPASRKDVHDHHHGRGSWEKRCRQQASILNVLTVVGSPVLALLLIHFNLYPLGPTWIAVGLGFALFVTSMVSFLVVAFKMGG